MSTLRRSSLRLFIEIAIWRHGVLWILVGGCLFMAAGLWWTWVVPQRQALYALTSRMAIQMPRHQVSQPGAQEIDLHVAAWHQVRQTWPRINDDNGAGSQEQKVDGVDLHTLIAGVLEAADRHGVQIEQADVQYRPESELKALCLTMNVPMRGRYLEIRQVVEAVLRAHPYVALDELLIKRESVASSETEVKARFIAWYRMDPVIPSGVAPPVHIQRSSFDTASVPMLVQHSSEVRP